MLLFSYKVMSDSLRPCGLQPCPWDSPGRNTGVCCHFLLQGDLPNPGIEPRSPALQADSLLTEPPGKPMCKIDSQREPAIQHRELSSGLCDDLEEWEGGLRGRPCVYIYIQKSQDIFLYHHSSKSQGDLKRNVTASHCTSYSFQLYHSPGFFSDGEFSLSEPRRRLGHLTPSLL